MNKQVWCTKNINKIGYVWNYCFPGLDVILADPDPDPDPDPW